MTTKTNESDAVDDQYRPIYEFDEDAGPLGEVYCRVPRDDQIKALHSIAGNGAVEPDGWIQGYSGAALPVIDGVPLPVIEQSKTITGGREGVESWTEFAVDDTLGPVMIQRAGRHPENVSKIKVKEKKQ